MYKYHELVAKHNYHPKKNKIFGQIYCDIRYLD